MCKRKQISMYIRIIYLCISLLSQQCKINVSTPSWNSRSNIECLLTGWFVWKDLRWIAAFQRECNNQLPLMSCKLIMLTRGSVPTTYTHRTLSSVWNARTLYHISHFFRFTTSRFYVQFNMFYLWCLLSNCVSTFYNLKNIFRT